MAADPYLQLTFDAKRRVALAARSVDLPPGTLAWGLWEVWEDVWRRKDARVPAAVLAGCVGTDPRIPAALVAFGFLVVEAEGTHRLSPEDERRILLTHQQRVAAGKARAAGAERSAGGVLVGRSSDSPAGPPAADQRATSGPPAPNQRNAPPAANSQQPAVVKKKLVGVALAAPRPPADPREGGDAPHTSLQPIDLADLWNVFGVGVLPTWSGMALKRETAAKARIREHPDGEWWAENLRQLLKSSFLCGENDRGWRANPDWWLRPGSAESVLEGKYAGRAVSGRVRGLSDPNQGILTRDAERTEPPEEIEAANRRSEEVINGG